MPVTDLGPWTNPALLILTSLAGGPKHGYAMMEDIAAIASVQLGPGTLYGVIARLELHGWIEALPASDRRHPYQLTAAGLSVLREHLAILERFAATGLERVAAL